MSLTTNHHHHRTEHSCLPAICPGQCPCNKINSDRPFNIFHFSFFCKFSFVLICAPATRSLRQLFICHLSWSGPYNKVLVPATWSWSLQQGHLMQFVICLVRCPCNKVISSSLSFLLISVICHLQVVKYPGPLKQLLKEKSISEETIIEEFFSQSCEVHPVVVLHPIMQSGGRGGKPGDCQLVALC